VIKGINKHYLLLHIIVFIWGFSPILGRFIETDAWQLVWFRIVLTLAILVVYFQFVKQSFRITTSHFWQLSGIGVIIAIHWLTFYGALKVSNVSVTMVAFSTGTLFSAIIEPLLFKRRIRGYEIVIGFIIMAGIALIFSVEFKFWLGITLGIVAAFTSSLFGVLNGLMVKQVEPRLITFYELLAALISISIYNVFAGKFTPDFFQINSTSWLGLLLLAAVCTVFPFIASVNLSKHISPYTIVLTVNLETVYGIIWAILFYHENQQLTPYFYLGMSIILLAILLNSYLKGRFNKDAQISK
jgi:drug/metabolite transporter (DMT)-like permease